MAGAISLWGNWLPTSSWNLGWHWGRYFCMLALFCFFQSYVQANPCLKCEWSFLELISLPLLLSSLWNYLGVLEGPQNVWYWILPFFPRVWQEIWDWERPVFLSTCCIPRKFYLLGTFFEVSQQPANQECCIGFAWQTWGGRTSTDKVWWTDHNPYSPSP